LLPAARALRAALLCVRQHRRWGSHHGWMWRTSEIVGLEEAFVRSRALEGRLPAMAVTKRQAGDAPAPRVTAAIWSMRCRWVSSRLALVRWWGLMPPG